MSDQTTPEPLTAERRLQIINAAIDRRLAGLDEEQEFIVPLVGEDLEALLKARNLLEGDVRLAEPHPAEVELAALREAGAELRSMIDDLTPGQSGALAAQLAEAGVLAPLEAILSILSQNAPVEP